MSAALVTACLWVLAASAVAMLPMRRQYVPGLILLLAAPALLIWIGISHGPWAAGLAALALISLFRRPLGYMLRKALNRTPKP